MVKRLKRFARENLPFVWNFLVDTRDGLVEILQRRMIRKGKTVYLGANDQDRWAVETVFPGKRGGFFMEIGGATGFRISNTYILEKVHGWNGICVEADPRSFAKLRKERSCVCVQACLDGKPGTVEYLYEGGIGGIIDTDTDIDPQRDQARIEKARNSGHTETIETKTLAQLLKENDAPKIIDFFSFDVEGSETRILRDFPFDDYIFLALIVERASPELNEILARNGYHFVELRVGDTFYVHESLPNFDAIPKQPFKQAPAKPAPLEINFHKRELSPELVIEAFF